MKLANLSKSNTAPFLIVPLLYSLILFVPFIIFSVYKSVPHTSGSATMYQSAEGSGDAVEESSSATNDAEATSDEGFSEQQPINIANWETNADSRGFIMLTRIAIFSSILAFGALGAATSLISRIKTQDIPGGGISMLEILSVQTVGAIFALILGFVFMGNLIAGTLFPNPVIFYRIIYVPPAFAKLLVWSFIAGFSERFVPQILFNLTRKAIDRPDKDEVRN